MVENLYRMNGDIDGKVDNKNAVLQSTFCVVIAVNALGGRAVLPSGREEKEGFRGLQLMNVIW